MNMKRIFSLAIISLLLSSCNIANVFPTVDLAVGLTTDGTDESQIRIAYNFLRNTDTGVTTFDGYTFSPVRLQASANPGSIGAIIDSYSIDYFLAGGSSVATDSGQSYRGTLGLRVPDGVICRETRPEPEPVECTINTPTAEYAHGDAVLSDYFYPIDVDVASNLRASPASEGAFAVITVEGRDANGNAFSQRLEPVTIVTFTGEITDFDPPGP